MKPFLLFKTFLGRKTPSFAHWSRQYSLATSVHFSRPYPDCLCNLVCEHLFTANKMWLSSPGRLSEKCKGWSCAVSSTHPKMSIFTRVCSAAWGLTLSHLNSTFFPPIDLPSLLLRRFLVYVLIWYRTESMNFGHNCFSYFQLENPTLWMVASLVPTQALEMRYCVSDVWAVP